MFKLLTCFSFFIFTIRPVFSEHFIVIGDSGKRNAEQSLVAQALLKHCLWDSCDFGVLTGDNVYPAGVKSKNDTILEESFDKYYNPINIPFMIALGNHDYGKLSFQKKRASFQLLHAQKNSLFVLPHYWYIKETPNAVFAVIDTTRLMWKKNIESQEKLIQNAHQRSIIQKKWFFVVGHHPFLSNGPHGNAGKYDQYKWPHFVSGKHVKKFIKKNVCGKAHFYLSGHDHSLQLIDANQRKCDLLQLVSGSAAEITSLKARNKSLFAGLSLGFFAFKIDHSQMTLKAFNEENAELFERIIPKKDL